MKKLRYVFACAVLFFGSCHNSDWSFPDFDYTTVYFAYQYPVRTIVLGEDIYDTTLDNEHKCRIMATMGGVYSNKQKRILNVSIDNDLAEKVWFADGDGNPIAPVQIMPQSYYSIPSDMTITIPKGEIAGGMEVQLHDAFFDDPLSTTNTYVIPMRIDGVINADSVLSGYSTIDDPNIHDENDWIYTPKDYILYCVKYINPWTAYYLRRGQDIGTGKVDPSLNINNVRHAQYVEKNEVVNSLTRSMSEVEFTFSTKDNANQDIPFTMVVKFDAEENCTVTGAAGAPYTISGTGKFVKKGDKNSWGNKDRDALYLDYTVDFPDVTYAIKDTLTYRDRGIALETFNPLVVP